MIALNLDLFETNVINLGVVIGVLIYIGGDLLDSILQTRKETILKNLNDAKERFEQACSDLAEAKDQLQLAKREVGEIQTQTNAAKIQRFKILLDRAKEEKTRFQESQALSLEIEEAKSISRLCYECSDRALLGAKDKVKTRLRFGDKHSSQQHKLIANNIYILCFLDL
jgi:F-type H+-transporting ATPase subunit b